MTDSVKNVWLQSLVVTNPVAVNAMRLMQQLGQETANFKSKSP